MIQAIKKFFKNITMSDDERYLAKSVDLVDLERRQRKLQTKGFRV